MSDPTTPDRPTPEAPTPTTPAKPGDAASTSANGTTTAPTRATTGVGSTPVGGARSGESARDAGRKSPDSRTGEKTATGDQAVDGRAAKAADSGDAKVGSGGKVTEDAKAADDKASPGKTDAGDDTIEIGTVGLSEKSASAGQQSAAVTPAGSAVPDFEPSAAQRSGALSVWFGISWRRSSAKKQAKRQLSDKPPGTTIDGDRAAAKKSAGSNLETGKTAAAGKKPWWRRIRVKRGPWLTVGGILVVLALLAVVGYVWGLGPLNRLNAQRSMTPPAKLAGLDRITDPQIRSQAQLDQTREALSRINDGKQVTVEAYGSFQGDQLFVLIALRGRVDIDKTVADSGATGDQIKKVGSSTCVETPNLPTQCYRGSSTLTVIVQSANDGVTVDAVEPVAEEAFNAMK